MMVSNPDQTARLGTLIINRDGHTAGPRYGRIYTVPQGQHGYIAGVVDRSMGNGALYERAWFPTLTAAQNYLVRLRVY